MNDNKKRVKPIKIAHEATLVTWYSPFSSLIKNMFAHIYTICECASKITMLGFGCVERIGFLWRPAEPAAQRSRRCVHTASQLLWHIE